MTCHSCQALLRFIYGSDLWVHCFVSRLYFLFIEESFIVMHLNRYLADVFCVLAKFSLSRTVNVSQLESEAPPNAPPPSYVRLLRWLGRGFWHHLPLRAVVDAQGHRLQYFNHEFMALEQHNWFNRVRKDNSAGESPSAHEVRSSSCICCWGLPRCTVSRGLVLDIRAS